VLPPPKGYLQRLREICDKHGILLIFDEVITGFGRLGHAFAAERYGVVPDMITFAKGVTSGTVPMGGVIVRKGIYDAFMKGPEHVIELFHGYTYSGHPLAAAASSAPSSLRTCGPMPPALQSHPLVADIRTIGLTVGIDLVPVAGSPGKRAYDVMETGFHDHGPDGADHRRYPGAVAAAHRQRKPDRRDVLRQAAKDAGRRRLDLPSAPVRVAMWPAPSRSEARVGIA
jgi:beta-alanine--pyruvate transaminase